MSNKEMSSTNGQLSILTQKTATDTDSNLNHHHHLHHGHCHHHQSQQQQHSDCNDNWAVDGTLTDAQLTQVLVQTLLPSFAKEIRLQALVAYQVDDSCNRSLIVNRCFKRRSDTQEQPQLVVTNGVHKESEEEEQSGKEEKRQCLNVLANSSLLNDSGVESESTQVRVDIKQEYSSCCAPSCSRRKRKFCRPCKIPQLTTNSNKLVNISPNSEQFDNYPLIKLEYKPQPMHIPENVPTPMLSAYLGMAKETDQQQALQEQAHISIQTTSVSNVNNQKLSNSTPRPIRPRILPNQSHSLAPILPLAPLHGTTSAVNVEIEGNGENCSLSRRYAKLFVCNQCKVVFTSLNFLCEHTYALHKAFRCNFCGAQFTQRSNLQRHSLRHVDFKPFVCGVCEKEYYRKDHLVRHIEVTHAGTDAKNNIIVKLSSAECLDYLNALTVLNNPENNLPVQPILLPPPLPPSPSLTPSTTNSGSSLVDTPSLTPANPNVVMTTMEQV